MSTALELKTQEIILQRAQEIRRVAQEQVAAGVPIEQLEVWNRQYTTDQALVRCQPGERPEVLCVFTTTFTALGLPVGMSQADKHKDAAKFFLMAALEQGKIP